LLDPISTEKKLGMIVCSCHLNDGDKLTKGELQSRPAWAKKQDLIVKITRAKTAGSMAQVVECLPGKL
jgi:hypothetical protein